jgi:hypothetical protein
MGVVLPIRELPTLDFARLEAGPQVPRPYPRHRDDGQIGALRRRKLATFGPAT